MSFSGEKKNGPSSHYNDIPDFSNDTNQPDNNNTSPKNSFYPSKKSTKPLIYSNSTLQLQSKATKSAFYCDSFELSKLQLSSNGSFTFNQDLLECFYHPNETVKRKEFSDFICQLFIKYGIYDLIVQGSLMVYFLKGQSLHFCNFHRLEEFIHAINLDNDLLDKLDKEVQNYLFG